MRKFILLFKEDVSNHRGCQKGINSRSSKLIFLTFLLKSVLKSPKLKSSAQQPKFKIRYYVR